MGRLVEIIREVILASCLYSKRCLILEVSNGVSL